MCLGVRVVVLEKMVSLMGNRLTRDRCVSWSPGVLGKVVGGLWGGCGVVGMLGGVYGSQLGHSHFVNTCCEEC